MLAAGQPRCCLTLGSLGWRKPPSAVRQAAKLAGRSPETGDRWLVGRDESG